MLLLWLLLLWGRLRLLMLLREESMLKKCLDLLPFNLPLSLPSCLRLRLRLLLLLLSSVCKRILLRLYKCVLRICCSSWVIEDVGRARRGARRHGLTRNSLGNRCRRGVDVRIQLGAD